MVPLARLVTVKQKRSDTRIVYEAERGVRVKRVVQLGSGLGSEDPDIETCHPALIVIGLKLEPETEPVLAIREVCEIDWVGQKLANLGEPQEAISALGKAECISHWSSIDSGGMIAIDRYSRV